MTEITNEMWGKAYEKMMSIRSEHFRNCNWLKYQYVDCLRDLYINGNRSQELYDAIMGLS